MKVTDYCPRAAPFDTHLMALGRNLEGVEVGVDVGAHAEAMLRYCPVGYLHLIDPWDNPRMFGIIEGRMAALGFGYRVRYINKTSLQVVGSFADGSLDFVYLDQEHEHDAVTKDLFRWWEKLRHGGILGLRNFTDRDTPLDRAANEFLLTTQIVKASNLDNEITLWKP